MFQYNSDGTDLSVGTFTINGRTTSINLRYAATVMLNVKLTEITNAEPWPRVIREYPRAVQLYASSELIQVLNVCSYLTININTLTLLFLQSDCDVHQQY